MEHEGTGSEHAGRRRGMRRATGLLGSAGLALGAVVLAAAPAGAGTGSLAQAKHDLLTSSDFPSGWTASGAVTTSNGGAGSSFPGGAQLAACMGVSAKTLNLNAPTATSPTFKNGSGTSYIQNIVTVFPSAKVATKEYAALASSKLPACMTTALKGPAGQQLSASIGSGAKVGAFKVTKTPSSWLPRHTAGFDISFPFTESGINFNAKITMIVMVHGTYGSQVVLTSVGTPIAGSLAHGLAATASARI